MKSKAPLVLMEQMIMLLVFALAAALCLQAFVKSDSMSRTTGDRDRAAVLCQNAAETIRAADGDFEQAAALLDAAFWDSDAIDAVYGEDLAPLGRNSTDTIGYDLKVYRIESGADGLGKAHISVAAADGGGPLFELDVAWQEPLRFGTEG